MALPAVIHHDMMCVSEKISSRNLHSLMVRGKRFVTFFDGFGDSADVKAGQIVSTRRRQRSLDPFVEPVEPCP
jgi:hypothetical protein